MLQRAASLQQTRTGVRIPHLVAYATAIVTTYLVLVGSVLNKVYGRLAVDWQIQSSDRKLTTIVIIKLFTHQ